MKSSRSGFTLIELLISMVATSIVGLALVKLMMADMRFTEDREAWRTARQAARSGYAAVTADLRMVETSNGVEAAASGGKDLTVRVPYAFGVMCQTNGSSSVLSMMRVDSAMFAQTGHSGFAWRNDTTQAYTYVSGGAVSVSGSASICTAAGIQTVTGGFIATVTGTIPTTRPVGTVFMLYRRIRYEIKASVQMPGQTALWRTPLNGGTAEELAAPFASTARFRFYTGNPPASQDAVPSPLSLINGFELAFDGQSDRTPRGQTGPKAVRFASDIFFLNVTP
jgi:prepilin-type N-terminal cleavage/methylation domain-containing protein